MEFCGIDRGEIDSHVCDLSRLKCRRAPALGIKGDGARWTCATAKSPAMHASNDAARMVRAAFVCHAILPWHCLYFLPLPHGQGSLRPTLGRYWPATASAASVSCDTLPSSLGWM